jgi:hypothetical protein
VKKKHLFLLLIEKTEVIKSIGIIGFGIKVIFAIQKSLLHLPIEFIVLEPFSRIELVNLNNGLKESRKYTLLKYDL